MFLVSDTFLLVAIVTIIVTVSVIVYFVSKYLLNECHCSENAQRVLKLLTGEQYLKLKLTFSTVSSEHDHCLQRRNADNIFVHLLKGGMDETAAKIAVERIWSNAYSEGYNMIYLYRPVHVLPHRSRNIISK